MNESFLQKISSNQTQASTNSESCSSDEEVDPGLRRPKAFLLDPKSFDSGLDYVKAFIREAKKLHHTDPHNEERKAQALGKCYYTEN
jgi:hypothetical protein